MPNRTDDPPRTKPQIGALPASQSAVSPVVSPAVQTTDDHLLTHESFHGIFSSNQRAGRWEPADEIEVLAVCGEVTLDFTDVELPPGAMIEIEALSICGEVTIIVPNGAEIELDGTPILGSIEQEVGRKRARRAIAEPLPAAPPPAEPPYFRIDARAILGTVRVKGG